MSEVSKRVLEGTIFVIDRGFIPHSLMSPSGLVDDSLSIDPYLADFNKKKVRVTIEVIE